MKLYEVDLRYYGTQAEAKEAAKAAGIKFAVDDHSVEVPTDKPGLIAFLNELVDEVVLSDAYAEERLAMFGYTTDDLSDPDEDHYTTVVERQDPPIEDDPGDAPQTLSLQYLQTFFDQAPLTLQGELAVRAIDRLVAAAPKPVAPPATPVDQLREEVASDDDLFQ